ncbi:MAG: hypothetical protein IPG75_09905 [Gemmatimonadetes bacterium]|nr:hypothetical protein [Gemmatimonadota bacterium]
MTADMPALTPQYETSGPNLFAVWANSAGWPLIKNAVNQGRDCVDVIASR